MKEFRSKTFNVEGTGSYVVLFQRPGEDIKFDLEFFDGNRSHQDTIKMAETLEAALSLADDWDCED